MAEKPVLNKMEGGKPIYPSKLYENFEMTLDFLYESINRLETQYSTAIEQLKNQFIPIGTIMGYPSDNIPSDFLLCDGRLLNISDYQSLYNAIGDIYNKAEDNNPLMFRIPDFRGIFLRGCGKNENQEVLQSESLGILQDCALPDHYHNGIYHDGSNNDLGDKGNLTLTSFNGNNGGRFYKNGKTGEVNKENNENYTGSIYQQTIKEVRTINMSVNWIIKCKNLT